MAMAVLVLRAAEGVDAQAGAWSEGRSRLEQVARRCAQAAAPEWSSRAGEAFRGACDRRIGELTELIALAQDAEAALRAHADALRDLAASLPELPDLSSLPDLLSVPELPELASLSELRDLLSPPELPDLPGVPGPSRPPAPLDLS